MQRCRECVLPSSYPGITFNAEGVCNHCEHFGTIPPKGEAALRELVEQSRDESRDYDCILGLSGGRDSAFALWYATQELGLRVLTFTVDNGLLPDGTRRNIENTLAAIPAKHVVVKTNVLRRNSRAIIAAWLKHPSPAMVSMFCVGCRWALFRTFLRLGRQYQIPMLLSGTGEPEAGFASHFFEGGSSAGSLVRGLSQEFYANPRYLLRRPTLPFWMAAEYAYAFGSPSIMQRWRYPDLALVKLFEYLAWDEDRIMTTITQELGWRPPAYSEGAWRTDCKISLLKNHFYYRMLGFTKNDDLVSNLIRLGRLTREEGLARIEAENELDDAYVREFLDELGIPYSAYMEGLGEPDSV